MLMQVLDKYGNSIQKQLKKVTQKINPRNQFFESLYIHYITFKKVSLFEYTLFHKLHFYKQRQAEFRKKLSKS